MRSQGDVRYVTSVTSMLDIAYISSSMEQTRFRWHIK